MADATGTAATPPATITQAEREENDHVAVLYNGALPAPETSIAKSLHQMDLQTQRDMASALFEFLEDDSSQLLSLNEGNTPMAVLINLPDSSKVKLLYGLGMGSSGIGHTASRSLCYMYE